MRFLIKNPFKYLKFQLVFNIIVGVRLQNNITNYHTGLKQYGADIIARLSVLCVEKLGGWKKPGGIKNGSNFNETTIRSRCAFRTPDEKMEP